MSDETKTARSAPASISERTCVHPRCGQWGCFGLERGREGPSYWCREHLPADYWTPQIGRLMSRHEQTRLALVELLRTFGHAPTGLYSVGLPMVGQGFSQEEILYALMSLDREKAIELLPENQLRVLRL